LLPIGFSSQNAEAEAHDFVSRVLEACVKLASRHLAKETHRRRKTVAAVNWILEAELTRFSDSV